MTKPITIDEQKQRLEELLKRRDNYFLLSEFQRRMYVYDFEKMQEEIMFLKINLEVYHDELDLVSVWVNYLKKVESKIQYEILEKAAENREIKWLSKKYFYVEGKSEYIGLLLKDAKDIQDEWLRGIVETHLLKREGLMQCPWPTKIREE
jgi:hypothetical protein